MPAIPTSAAIPAVGGPDAPRPADPDSVAASRTGTNVGTASKASSGFVPSGDADSWINACVGCWAYVNIERKGVEVLHTGLGVKSSVANASVVKHNTTAVVKRVQERISAIVKSSEWVDASKFYSAMIFTYICCGAGYKNAVCG